MLGAAIIVVVLVVVLPMLFLMGGAVLAALIGWSAHTAVEADHEGSELVELS